MPKIRFINKQNILQNILPFIFLLGFLIVNSLKITMLNIYMLPPVKSSVFYYKLTIAFFAVLIVYILIINIKNKVPFIIFYILQIIYILANFLYYSYFHSYLHLLQSIELFGEGAGAAAALSFPKDVRALAAFMDLPLFILIIVFYRKVNSLLKRFKKVKIAYIVSAFVALFFIESWHYFHDYSLLQLVKDPMVGETLIVERYGTLGNSLSDIIVYSSNNSLVNNIKYGPEIESTGSPSTEKPNFVMIQIESLDANIINCKYNDKYITPFFHSLTENSIYYPYTMSYHKGGATSDCEFSSLNSVEPLDNFPSIKLNNYLYPNSIVSKLRKSGYNTSAFHGNIGSYFNRQSALTRMGFTEFYDMKRMNLKDVGWGAPDHLVFDNALKELKAESEPFFYYIITMTSHGPFTNASYYFHEVDYYSISDVTLRNYFNSMTYVDRTVEKFVNQIQKDFKNTYIIIYGDHTPNVNDERLFRQASYVSEAKYFEFVPTFIITPDKKVYRETEKVASFLDIAPTVLYNSGIPFRIKSQGQNLIETPIKDTELPFKGDNYKRSFLMTSITNATK